MDLFPRPLRSSRAFHKVPKDYDTSQARLSARGQHENAIANSEAKAPIDYQHLRDFRRAKLAERKFCARLEPNRCADPRATTSRALNSRI